MSFGVILTVRFAVVAILSSIGTGMWRFLRNPRNPTGPVVRGRETKCGDEAAGPCHEA